MRWWAILALVWLVPLPALGQSRSSFELEWQAPSGCPSQGEVSGEVEHLLGATKAQRGPVEATARVTQAAGGFELNLTLLQDRQARERILRAPSCAELGHAAALVLALAVNPALESDPRAAATQLQCPELPAPSPPPPCPSCPRCKAPERPLVVRVPTRAWRAAAFATASVAYGELPQITPRPGLGASYRSGAHSFELSFGAAFGSLSRGTQRVATFSQWFAAPRYCLAHDEQHWRVGVCGSIELGWVRASGHGVTDPKTSRSLWLAPALGAQASWKASSSAELLIGADLALGAVRQRFFLADEQVFRTHLFIPALRLGVLAGIL